MGPVYVATWVQIERSRDRYRKRRACLYAWNGALASGFAWLTVSPSPCHGTESSLASTRQEKATDQRSPHCDCRHTISPFRFSSIEGEREGGGSAVEDGASSYSTAHRYLSLPPDAVGKTKDKSAERGQGVRGGRRDDATRNTSSCSFFFLLIRFSRLHLYARGIKTFGFRDS